MARYDRYEGRKVPWYDSDSETRWMGGIAKWVIAAVVLVLLIGGGIWALKVATAPVKGRGDAFTTKESGSNRISAQERFEDLYQEILATDRKIDQAAAKVEANPDSNVAQTEYTGLVNYCLDVVADYNAEARKYTSEDFRSADLPEEISNTNPETDCEESK